MVFQFEDRDKFKLQYEGFIIRLWIVMEASVIVFSLSLLLAVFFVTGASYIDLKTSNMLINIVELKSVLEISSC